MFPIQYAFLAMVIVITTSNILVQFPINEWLTWGAFPYPIAFLITELTTRFHGAKKARSVAYTGFALGVAASVILSTPRIGMASGVAFLISQLLDIKVFNRLRQFSLWWLAPLAASILASFIDSILFWTLAFYGERLPFITWALGDTLVKFSIDILMLLPFRVFITHIYSNK